MLPLHSLARRRAAAAASAAHRSCCCPGSPLAAPPPAARRTYVIAQAAKGGKQGGGGGSKKGKGSKAPAGAAPPPPLGHGSHTVAAAAVAVAAELAAAPDAAAASAAGGGAGQQAVTVVVRAASAARLGAGFAGGAAAGEEVDVKAADSDEELDGGGAGSDGGGGDGAAELVPAGVLGAAGLAGVQSAELSRAASGAPAHHRCLVLDASYRPINTINWFKAVTMDIAGKVDVLDYYEAFAYSAYQAHSLPAVLRARANVNLHEITGRVALTRRNILARDRHMCQYCGSRSNLTLDHVVPVCKGGKNSWTNLVACCMHCNQRKGGALLRELGWRLKAAPREPTMNDLGLMLGVSQSDLDNPPAKWQAWLEPYQERMSRRSRRAQQEGPAANVAAPAVAQKAKAPASKAAAR